MILTPRDLSTAGQRAADCPDRPNDFIDPVQAALTLPRDDRVETRIPVPRDLELHRPDLGQHRLGAAGVSSSSARAAC
jgi:hypothetical protein